jgi:hypothetical protein
MTRVASLFLVLSLLVAEAHAGLLPITDVAQYSHRKLDISGCLTTGSYDVTTMVWQELGSFARCSPYPTIPGPDGTRVTVVGFETRLLGHVDHDGNVLDGTFTAFGAIPALGIGAPTLLMRGSLIAASYGPPLLSDTFFPGIGINALVELEFALPVFGNPGDFLLWPSNALVSGWNYPPSQFPNAMPWHSSVTEADYHNYTNTQYMVYDRGVFLAPEPSTLSIFGLGLPLGVALRRRRHA